MTIQRFVMILEDILIGNIDECQVVPELDAPAHVGAGWQAVDEKLTVCVNREPWTEWSVDVDGDENDDHGGNNESQFGIRFQLRMGPRGRRSIS